MENLYKRTKAMNWSYFKCGSLVDSPRVEYCMADSVINDT